MNLKTRTLNVDPRAINRTLFYTPFNPKVNLAIEDPLLLASNDAIKEEGINFARTYATGSPLSEKAAELLDIKRKMEVFYSKKSFFESSIILTYQESVVSSIEDAFLSTQMFLVPDRIKSPFSSSNTIYFSSENLFSIIDILKKHALDHTPVLFLPKLSPKTGRINFEDIEALRKDIDFFLIVEDHFTFGIEGLTGFGSKSESALIDLKLTHIPKNFGKMLTVVSGKRDFINTLLNHSFTNASLFPPAAYLGMFSKTLSLIESFNFERKKIQAFCDSLSQTFGSKCEVHSPTVTFFFATPEEKDGFYKSLVDNGFLLPSSPLNGSRTDLTLYINHCLNQSAIHHFQKALDSVSKQIICESI